MVYGKTARARAPTPSAAPAQFKIAPRIDLRTGSVAAGVARVEAPLLCADWVALMTDARKAWRDAGYVAPLSCRAPGESLADAVTASDLDAALRAAGFVMRGVTIEVDEAALLHDRDNSMAALERLRARGWGVMLRSAPDCPLPLGGALRGVFTDIWAEPPADLTPFLGLEGYDDAPLARRVRAAANAGLAVTAAGLNTLAHVGLLIAGGFDRGEGPGVKLANAF
jgi:hypothetical protein